MPTLEHTRFPSSADLAHWKNTASIQPDIGLVHVNVLQYAFEDTLGISSEEDIQSYNLVFDRFNFERIHSNSTLTHEEKQQQKQAFRKTVEQQMLTNLRERYQVISSTYRLDITGEKLYSEHLQTQPLEEIYWRGVLHRRNHGSNELEREENEFLGFLAQQALFTDSETNIGTKLVVLSPPGRAKDTLYAKNFVDILELKHDPATHKKYVHATRYASTHTYEEYKMKASLLDPHYYHEVDNALGDDSWLLSHPIVPSDTYSHLSSDALYETMFMEDPLAMKSEDFRKAIENDTMQFLITHYIDEVQKNTIDWREAAKAFNAVLNFGDHRVEQLREQKKKQVSLLNAFPSHVTVFAIDTKDSASLGTDAGDPRAFIDHWGTKAVQTIAAGCGKSSGYSLDSGGIRDLFAEKLENSVARFGLETADYKNDTNLCRCGGSEPHFHCPGKNGACNHAIIVGRGTTNCPACGQGKTC